MTIGELARRTGVGAKTIRYYESIGVLPEPARAPNGYRIYAGEMVERLLFVRDAQAAGLTLAEIGAILETRDQGGATCEHVVELLAAHVGHLDTQIATLRTMRRRLARLIDRARRLDPAECTNPHRCQTIAPRSPSAPPGRAKPAAHRH